MTSFLRASFVAALLAAPLAFAGAHDAQARTRAPHTAANTATTSVEAGADTTASAAAPTTGRRTASAQRRRNGQAASTGRAHRAHSRRAAASQQG